MKLSNIFDALVEGELAQHAFGNKGTPELERYASMGQHTQIALRQLCTRFAIIEKTVTIRMIADQTDYLLDPKHADSVSNSETKWIVDTAENPFVFDILGYDTALLPATTADEEDTNLGINDKNDVTAIQTPTYNTIRIPEPEAGKTIVVTYRADHPDLGDIVDPEAIDVNLPLALFEPLLCYIAARVFSMMGNEVGNAKSSFYFGKYNAMADELERKNTLNTGLNYTNTKLEDRGFA